MNIVKGVKRFLRFFVPEEKDEPLYKQKSVTVEKVFSRVNLIVLGMEGRLFVLREEGEKGKASVQEYDRQTFRAISRKVYSNPDSFRFGCTPLEDLAEYLLFKVRSKQPLPRIQNQKVDYTS